MLKAYALFAVAAAAVAAQTTTVTVTGPVSVVAGNVATLTVSMAGSSGQNIAAIQWTLTLPAGVSLGAPTASAGWTAAGDAAYCNAAAGTCLVAGSLTVQSDGAIATIPVTFAATVTPGILAIPITGLFAAANLGGAGVFVNGMTASTPYTIKVQSRCDLNGDSVVNAADVQIVINAAIGATSCPLSGVSCNLVAVIDVINAATGGACKL